MMQAFVVLLPPSYEYMLPIWSMLSGGVRLVRGHIVPPQKRPNLSHLQSLKKFLSFSGSTETNSFKMSPKAS